MVKLRMKRFGRRNRAFYRLCAIDSRTRRDGRAIEELGIYDPVEKDLAKQVALKNERIAYWLSVGAQPSGTALRLIEKAGITLPKGVLRRRDLVRKQRAAHLAKKAAKAAASAPAAAAADAPAQPPSA